MSEIIRYRAAASQLKNRKYIGLLPRVFFDQKILAQTYFILFQNNFEGQKSWDSKYGSKRNCGSENVLAPKKFKFEQIFCPKIFGVKTTWGPKKYWRKNF